jgi:hypothetical protein
LAKSSNFKRELLPNGDVGGGSCVRRLQFCVLRVVDARKSQANHLEIDLPALFDGFGDGLCHLGVSITTPDRTFFFLSHAMISTSFF